MGENLPSYLNLFDYSTPGGRFDAILQLVMDNLLNRLYLFKGYLVEHKRTGSPHWVKASPIKVCQTQLTICGLEPGWRYQFRVTAENEIGYSDPSPLSEPLAIFVHRSAAIAPYFVDELSDMTVLENEKVNSLTNKCCEY